MGLAGVCKDPQASAGLASKGVARCLGALMAATLRKWFNRGDKRSTRF